jgi:PAS domain S-box-containing protein
MEMANDAIFIADVETGRLIEANRKAAEMIGVSVHEINGMHQSELHPREEGEKYRELFSRAISDGYASYADLFVVNREGKRIPVDISANVTEVKGNKVIQGIFKDISERKKAEEAIKESEARYVQAAEMACLGHWERNISTGHVFWSGETYRIFGVDPRQFEPTLESFISCVHPDDRTSLHQALKALMTNKDKYDNEYRIVRPDGEIRFIHSMGGVVLDANGEIVRIMGTVHDITERKQVEETLQWAEQLNIVAELTKGLSEEIRNAIAGIRASVEVLADRDESHIERGNIKRSALDAIERIRQTINNVLSFARPPRPHLVEVNMNDVIDASMRFSQKHPRFSFEDHQKISFITDYGRDIPAVMADPFQLQQIFLNLIFNAFEAMHEGGTITVKTSYKAEDDEIVITISDTGQGVKENMRDQIFQPFYSTKGKGTGLGLPITKRYIEQHGGKISVEGNPSGGATFRITHPVRTAEGTLV